MAAEQNIVGTFERVDFPDFGVSGVMAKIDTGAYTGAMHCSGMHEEETTSGKVLHFAPFGQKDKQQSTANYYIKHVKSSNGDRQKRFVIAVDIVIRGKTYNILLSLADRSEMKHPVLIGRRFLRTHKFVVDATQYKK